MKRTIEKALRPISSQALKPPPNIRLRIVEKMERLVKDVLNGSHLDIRYLFILDYLTTVVEFHNAADQKTKNEFYDQIRENEDKGQRFGFNEEELKSLNFLVLQEKTRGRLPALEKRIKEKQHN